MRALDIGCGAGFNTEALAELVDADGSVVAVDLQPKMLGKTRRRLERRGLAGRVELVEATDNDLGLNRGGFDFALAFWMVHEVADQRGLFAQIRDVLRCEESRVLVVEPKLHVKRAAFNRSAGWACELGFVVHLRPKVALSRAVSLGPPPAYG